MDVFDRLAPFIQDYIYKENWETLRDIQVAACDIIFNTENNLLLASQTASGKTEAAFLPTLTKIWENKTKSVGILYISPLKALINDQFYRLDGLLEESGIPVTKWHGDANATLKAKLLKNPQGVMQTTPESLESMLMRRKTDALRLFSDLRYIIIDEVHFFMSEYRGVHLLCLIERIQRLTKNIPIRIGLSATLGDYSSAEKWLSTSTNKKCSTPQLAGKTKKLQLSLEHFYVKFEAKKEEEKALMNNYYKYLYAATFRKKSIIFSNSKAEVEENIGNLKKIAQMNKTQDVYLVHHGNISASIREYTEDVMKKSDTPMVTGATVTLELGIDLGELERIVQTGCPFSVSSFVQRLGRSGRRDNPSQMWFAFREDTSKVYVEFYKTINWSFLVCIAIIQLYLEEKWIEPIYVPLLPYGILYHQTMSYMVSAGEVEPALLAQNVLSLSAFSHVSKEDYQKLLRFMIDIEQLEVSENNGLLVGAKGEREINNYDFYTVFENPKEISVKCNSEEIGTVQEYFPIGERFGLAGLSWEVLDIDKDAGIIFVKEINGVSPNNWQNDGGHVMDTKILKKVKQILESGDIPRYLSQDASERLHEMRELVESARITKEIVVQISGNCYGVFPFLGSKHLVTLSYALLNEGIFNELYFDKSIPICIFIKDKEYDEIIMAIDKFVLNGINKYEFDLDNNVEIKGKYNEFIPVELLKKQYIEDFLDESFVNFIK